ncbi:MAG: phosphoglycerate kinase [Desulfatiglandales bacterium]
MEGHMRLRDYKKAEIRGKVVLVRVDHNVVKKGKVVDPYRIEATIPTLVNIALKGGMPVLMTHVGRPKDKKSGKIMIREEESVRPVVEYLRNRLDLEIYLLEYEIPSEGGIGSLGDVAKGAVDGLRSGRWDMVYLPNTRWFEGEEAKDEKRDRLAKELSSLGELFVNDAFGSWQAHVSTYYVTQYLPSYAGSLLQREVKALKRLYEPKRPFVAVIAGSKYDTKIGPINVLYDLADHLILGGVIYNAYLGAKYDLEITGVSPEDKELARDLVNRDREKGKILELKGLVENRGPDLKDMSNKYEITLQEAVERKHLGAILDVGGFSFEDRELRGVLLSAKTIFVNAVMGLMPHYPEGSRALYKLVYENREAEKFLAGGDTLQEFRNLCPGDYMKASEDPKTCFFTGGGAVLTAIEQGSPFGLKPIGVLSE